MNREQPLRYATVVALLGLSFAGAAQTPQSKPPQKDQQGAKQQSTATHANNQKQSEGQTIFEQNCARCHTPPDGFSPRISGTIVRHMRVRASLSAHDEQELLRFLNP
jgi:mono/diheme cytochrome c family protein